ncbi:uroporphyrinogen-III synthase [Thalassotalea sp. ND16A]|uniref:uroporphyrinogen-III synthase n=1 Tax=Thalassotalea sp. ND16A TaxID=1535422 RepID=UPI00051D1190|nr:uroporphyrinogen-III synthase [Thalassotalea sp. ND16A]KGJ92223.1 hypothetical protein ND16A_1742 [Thalassotalea sp. ND16A]
MKNNKLRILLTRPLKKSQQLAKVIAPLASHIEITPLFDYQAGEQQPYLPQQLNEFRPDIIIFVSPAAVDFAFLQNPVQSKLTSALFIAVGTATADALKAHGIKNVITPEQQNSEGLLTLEPLLAVENQHILIVRGNGGRELIKQQLEQRGAKVAYNEVYKRQWLTLNHEQTIDKWRKDKINCIVVTSSELLQHTLSYIDDKDWANDCTWLVASSRIAERAKAHGLTTVINASGASHQHIYQALCKLVLNTSP